MRLLKGGFPIAMAAIIVLALFIVPATAETSITHTYDGKILMSTGMYWIKIDPVSDHIVGDKFLFTGVTNLPPGSRIIGQLFIRTSPCHQKTCNIDMNSYGNSNSSFVQDSSQGINSFSILINTSGIIPSDDYVFEIFPENGDIVGYGDNIVLFPKNFKENIVSSPSVLSLPQKRYWIWINPLTNESIYHENVGLVNSSFQLTGFTDLPVGDTVKYSIYPSSVIDEKFSEKNFVNFFDENHGIVTSGNSTGNNTFYLNLDMSKICPGVYYITLWNPRYNSSEPNDFLSTSTAFGFLESPNASVNSSCSPSPTVSGTVNINGSTLRPIQISQVTTTMSPSTTQSSPPSLFVNIFAVLTTITSSVVVQKSRRKK